MKSLRGLRSAPDRRGSALLMAFLMLIIIYAIVFQLWYTTSSDLRVTQNDVTTTQIDHAIESALQEVFDRLKTDAEAEADAGDSGAAPPATGAPGAGGAGGEGGGEAQGPTDSREDPWGRAQRTTIGEVELRILVQDEDSKLNLLTMLNPDEEEAEKAFERVVRVIDMFRDGSTVDLDRSEAIRIAEGMRRHLKERTNSLLPKPKLLSDSEEQRDVGMPLSITEFSVLPRVDESLFRDFRDERGYLVHSLGSYLTVWSSPMRGAAEEGASSGNTNSNNPNNNQGAGNPDGTNPNGGAGGQGGEGAAAEPNWGMAVNINTAPVAVLKALFDDRDVPPRLWDGVLEYRNMPEEQEDTGTGLDATSEPALDEYGQEIIVRQIFDSLEELNEIDGYERLEERFRSEMAQLLSVRSRVFSIFITARRKTGIGDEFGGVLGARRNEAREDVRGQGLVRTVRCVVWRFDDEDEIRIVPIVRWEVLDYTPFEVLDFPDDDR